MWTLGRAPRMTGCAPEAHPGTASAGPRRRFGNLTLTIPLFLAAGCGLLRSDDEERMNDDPPTIEEVQERHTPDWMELPGVVGTGIGLCDDEPCIRIFLSAPSPEAEKAIPERVEGYRVEVVVTGAFRPRSDGI
jgi:hypothetical protein